MTTLVKVPLTAHTWTDAACAGDTVVVKCAAVHPGFPATGYILRTCAYGDVSTTAAWWVRTLSIAQTVADLVLADADDDVIAATGARLMCVCNNPDCAYTGTIPFTYAASQWRCPKCRRNQ